MYQYKAKAERVVDGDTIDVTIDLGFKITTHQRIRLAGIDTPEIYSVKKDSDEYRRGITAMQFVEQRLAANNNQMIIETEKATGKFGRYIGTIKLSDNAKTLNLELVEKGFAVRVNY
ncbi:MAG: thermonuclease family protein [Bacteroidota bacterium]